MWKKIRTIFFSTITISIHFWILFQVFIENNILYSIIGTLLFFVFFHFRFLDQYNRDFSKTILFILGLTFLEILRINTFDNGNMVIGLIIMNLSSIYLAYTLKENADKSIVRKSSSYFWDGGYLFTLGISIAYSLFTIGIYNDFPFSCKDLNTNSDKIVEFVIKPFNITIPENTDPGQILNTTKVKDILSIGKKLNIESNVKGITPLENFKNRKDNIITKAIDENKELNQGICEYSLNKLQSKLKNPGFQIGAIILMMAIAYPFLRITTQLMSILAMLLFGFLKICKGYSIQKVTTEVEKIN